MPEPKFGEWIAPRDTIQEKPRVITDQELEDVRIKGSNTGEMSKNFSYADLVDNLTQTENDLKIVTGQLNREQLEQRARTLRGYIDAHPTSHIKRQEDGKNYEEGMSFNEVQRKFVKTFGVKSGYRSTNDYMEYLATKKVVDKNWSMKISEYGKVTLPSEYMDLTIGEAFVKIFPQVKKDAPENINEDK